MQLLSEVVDDDRALALAEKIEASVCSTEAIEHWSKELRELQKDSNHFDGQLGSQLLLTRAHSNHHTPISSAALRGSEKTLQLMLDWGKKIADFVTDQCICINFSDDIWLKPPQKLARCYLLCRQKWFIAFALSC